MDDATIAEIERWLREHARESERKHTEPPSSEPNDPVKDQERPFWPYLESDDFWRE